LFILRLWVGFNFIFAHGLKKISDPSAFINSEMVQRFPIPVVLDWLAILSEVVGGALLVLGLWTRVAAFGIFCTMVGAAFVVHSADPWTRKEFALVYAVIALVLLMSGGGDFSLDRSLRRKRR
jgi:putative oxidoreductase